MTYSTILETLTKHQEKRWSHLIADGEKLKRERFSQGTPAMANNPPESE